MSVQNIQDNLHKSFKGTFRNAMKNGYDVDTHYVIVDWKFFHQLLEAEKKAKVLGTQKTEKIGGEETMSVDKCEICGVEAFMRCEKHNRCDDCGFTKEESNKSNTHLVHRDGGLFCDPCWKIKIDKRIGEFSGDTECTGEITCPYCGSVNSDSWEFIDSDGSEIDCDDCDNKFNLSVNQSVDYSTSKITAKTEKIQEKEQ